MQTVKVVIGANYGDEGKGSVVNYLSGPGTTVVRFNGGAQAGHTVFQDGRREIFSSLGSGTLKGASTYWGPEFAIDPISVLQEMREGGFRSLDIHAHPDCNFVLPFDVILNQKLEEKRGGCRHGSCGMGFGESVRRKKHGFAMTEAYTTSKLGWIKYNYFDPRMRELGLSSWPEELEVIIRGWEKAFELLRRYVKFDHLRRSSFLSDKEDIVFEGAQGLCLKEDSTDFPHVTHSYTGLDNVVSMLDPSKHRLEVYYVTRSYLCRHGNGPLNGEWPEDVSWVLTKEDKTNVTNDFQGSLRAADLDLDRMTREIRYDIAKAEYKKFQVDAKIMVSWCDAFQRGKIDRIITDIEESTGLPVAGTKWGAEEEWLPRVDTQA